MPAGRGAVLRAGATGSTRLSGPRLAGPLAVVQAVLLAVVLAVLLGGCTPGAVDLGDSAPPAPQREACRDFVDALPGTVAELPRRDTERADGWGAAYGDPAIVVRCGMPTPEAYDDAAVCTNVNGVDWFIPLDQLEDDAADAYIMTTVNRTPRVEVVLPAEHFPPATAMADLSAPVNAHLAPSDEGCV